MSKYDPLGRYLRENNMVKIKLTFNEIEGILGFTLPMYLRKYAAAWYGTSKGSPAHVAKAVWQSVGYQVDTVNLVKREVVFRKL